MKITKIVHGHEEIIVEVDGVSIEEAYEVNRVIRVLVSGDTEEIPTVTFTEPIR